MKKAIRKKIFLIIAITAFVVLLLNSNTLFAAINEGYYVPDSVTDESLDEAFKDSTVLGLLARLIYAVGRFLEWILGTVFTMLTGTSDFPWADKIVFNAVPLLDVNFINPDAKSFVGVPNIQDVLKNTYATIFSLAAAFFGIVVLITAIKLVISTIASEKAKYKQAIVDWVIGFVMLFCIHYAISFIFYLNEQLVVVASNMVTSNLNDADVEIAKIQESTVQAELIKNIESRGLNDVAALLKKHPAVLQTYMNLASNDTSKGLHEFLMKKEKWYTFGTDVSKNRNEQYQALGTIINWAVNENISVQKLQIIRNNIKIFQSTQTIVGGNMVAGEFISNSSTYNVYSQALKEDTIDSIFGTYAPNIKEISNLEKYAKFGRDSGSVLIENVNGSKYYLTQGVHNIDATRAEGSKGADIFYWDVVLDDLIKLKSSSDTSTGTHISGSGSSRLISDLASYFRYNSFNKVLRTGNNTGLRNGNQIQIQNMIMYAILVGQSLILFISYVKRLFYVILLAMMAPIVVVFDFFQKFGK